MIKKIVGVFVIVILIITAMITMVFIKEKNQYDSDFIETNKGMEYNNYNYEPLNNNDQLDQSYTSNSYARNIGNWSKRLAQTFKPSYATITKIELLIDKEQGWPNFDNYYFELYSGVPGGSGSLIYRTSFGTRIYQGPYWAEIDIVDQSVLPGATYHMVIWGSAKTESTIELQWCFGFLEPYTNGDGYQYSNSEWNILQIAETPCDFCFKTYGTDFGGNHPPSIPSMPYGPSTGTTGTSYSYSTSSTDPDGDQIRYGFDWNGDGFTDWSDYETSGDLCSKSHSWSSDGTYQVRVKAQDEHGRESSWSDPLSVTMPKDKQYLPFGFIFAFGFDVDVKIVQLEPGENYVDLEVLSKPFYIWENEIITRNPGEFIRLYNAKGLFLPSLSICFGICDDWGIIG